MPIDAQIPLMGQQPQFASPVQTIGALMQLKGQTAEIALRQAQAEQAKQVAADDAFKAEQARRDQADQNTLQEAMSNPDIAPKIARGDLSDLYGKVQDKTLTAKAKAIQDYHKEQATLDTTTLTNRNSAYKELASSVTGLNSFGDDIGKINQALPELVQNLTQQGVFKNAGIDPNSVPKSISSVDDLKKWEASVGALQAVNDKALEIKGVQTKQAEEEANAAKAKAETEHQNLINKMLQGAGTYDPSSGIHPVDQVLPASLDKGQNASYRAAYDAAMKQPPDQNGRHPAADTILEQAAAHAATLSPTLLANKAATARAEAVATAPIHQAESMAVAAANRAGAEHITSEGEYQKSIAALNTSAADATRVHNLIAAAQGGNKAAPAMVPIAELRSYLNRINSTELRSVSSQAGTWADRVEGFIKGASEGQPVPPDILKATDELTSLQIQQAEQKHAGEVTAINIARHENLKPVKVADLGYQSTTEAPTPKTQAEFNALPKGAKFKKPNDQTVYTKQ